jgi:hypothetical protein
LVLEVLRFLFGILLIFVLPGTMLIKAMFPRKGELDEEYNGLYVITLGMAASVCLTILVGFVLGSMGPRDSGKGYFDAPFIAGSLAGLTIFFFIVAWYRGAFPWLGLLHPSLARFPIPAEAPRGTKRHDQLLAKIEELTKEHDHLKRKVKDLLRRERTHGRKMAEQYKERRKEAEKELERVRDELDIAKEEQSKLIYEAKQREDEKRKRREMRKEKREKASEESSLEDRALPGAEGETTEEGSEEDEAPEPGDEAEEPEEGEGPQGGDV